jgi:predicted nucleic acid-binding protein
MTAPDRLVLDSSIALAWCFADEKSSYADAIADLLPDLEAIVPALWHLEVANAFLMGERRGRNTPADTGRWFSFLASLPITIDDQTMARAWSDFTILARARSLTSYDAAYIELALRRGFPMATLDAKLKAAAIVGRSSDLSGGPVTRRNSLSAWAESPRIGSYDMLVCPA